MSRILCLLAAGALVVGCTSDDTTRSGLFEPYRADLPQGNYLTQAMLDQVTPGMRERDVRRVLGSPLMVDVFQPDRWNYVFRYRHPNGRVDSRTVVVTFDDGMVAKVIADALPPDESPDDPALPGFRPEKFDRALIAP